jgi:hypothetical protein
MPERGLYEVLITEALEAGLRGLGERLAEHRSALRSAEAPDRIALHLARIVRRAVADMDDDTRVTDSIKLARKLIEQIQSGLADDMPIDPGMVLRAVAARLPDGSAESILEPLIPLLDTALLTNAPGEPRVGHQVLTEIHSADRIDVVMAFIRRTGAVRHGHRGAST